MAAMALLQHRELGEQLGRHAGARLVAGPEVVAEALDHVVGRHAEVGDAVAQHLEHARQHALGGAELARIRPAEVLAEELVGAVEQVDDHGLNLSRSHGCGRTFLRDDEGELVALTGRQSFDDRAPVAWRRRTDAGAVGPGARPARRRP